MRTALRPARHPSVHAVSRWPQRWVLMAALVLCACDTPPAPEAPAPAPVEPVAPTEPAARPDVPAVPAAPAEQPEDRWIAIDTHVDTTQRMLDAEDDIAERMPDGHLDLPRMREGGLTGAFFSIWVRPSAYPGERAWQRTLDLIAAVRQLAETHPDEATLVVDEAGARRAAREGRAALLMGVEGAHALGAPEDPEVMLSRLAELYALGVRYMTVTWSNDNALGHSSGGQHPRRGLTELGRRAIQEMNRLGMIVDVSHVSDRTFWDILEVTERPPLASHSSSRALAAHPRNMTDRMIRAVAERGGAVCVNYYTSFIDREYGLQRRQVERAHRSELRAIRDAHEHSWQRWRPVNARLHALDPTLEQPTLATLGAHFAHVVSLGGPRAACLGSDFDGVGELPVGLEDVSELGVLREELERRELDARAIFGENVLRVLSAQAAADRAASPSTTPSE
ncbi:MAG: dipeptidase [Sandaracinaceae bacterium]